MSQYEIQIVITVNEEESCHLGQHKVIHICSAMTNEDGELENLKKYGIRITRLIKKKFPKSEAHRTLS